MPVIAAYGTLRRGQHNHRLIEGSVFVGKGKMERKAKMLAKKLKETLLFRTLKEGVLERKYQLIREIGWMCVLM